jgi:DNA-binding PadR family transcriptional regulator
MDQPLPLTEATFFILLSLVPGARHGYAILKEVEALSAGRVRLSTGTLYGALDRLLNLGWIARLDDEPTGGRGQKSYQLTALGRQIVQAETDRMAALVAVSQRRLREAE